jgi:hypothetical protein
VVRGNECGGKDVLCEVSRYKVAASHDPDGHNPGLGRRELLEAWGLSHPQTLLQKSPVTTNSYWPTNCPELNRGHVRTFFL